MARLAVDLNSVVPVERLIEDVWGALPPDDADDALREHVARIRKALVAAGAGALLVARPPGYVLEADPSVLDASRFEALVDGAHAHRSGGSPGRAAALLAEALAQWRGPALPELADATGMVAVAQRLEQLRQSAVDAHQEAEQRSEQRVLGP